MVKTKKTIPKDRKRQKHLYRSQKRDHLPEEHPGFITGLMDCNKRYIVTGDIVKEKNTGIEGPVLWNDFYGRFGLFFRNNKDNRNFYDPTSYCCFIEIPRDNGGRMNYEVIKPFNRNGE